jgi:hypothetical protein
MAVERGDPGARAPGKPTRYTAGLQCGDITRQAGSFRADERAPVHCVARRDCLGAMTFGQ